MSNCLDCPDENNYAAIALQLQETAFQAEACLYAAETSLREVTNPQTILWTLTAPVAVLSNLRTTIGTSAGTTSYSNSTRINMSSLPWVAGVWEVGACITAAAAGAVNADTYRTLSIAVHRSGDPASIDRYLAFATMTEPNDGVGVDMICTTTVVLTAADAIVFYFQHGNTSSNLNIATGALFWATRLSDATALRVV